MITVLLCRCANAEPIARKIMATAHYSNWQTQPVIKGKSECLAYVSSLPENVNTGSLYNFIEHSSSWSIILGEKNGTYMWANAGDGSLQGRLDAELIVEKFGNE